MNIMAKKVIIFLIILSLLLINIYLNRGVIFGILGIWFPNITKLEKITDNEIKEIKKKIMAPPPLIGTKDSPEAFLSHDGVVARTNLERKKQGAANLKVNVLLDKAAKAKLDDMFGKGYFAHESPSGRGPSDLADQAKYEYVIIGENLAQGNFEDDAELVQAWMDSPGHRENILNGDYREIGVAVGRGTYEGKATWMAVQEFGTPLSVCPPPDPAMKERINNSQDELTLLEISLKEKRDMIDSSRAGKRFNINGLVKEFNQLVRDYNSKVEAGKQLIKEYNVLVSDYNECLTEY
jgi:hypothetical protein